MTVGLTGNPPKSPEIPVPEIVVECQESEVCVANTSYMLIIINNWREDELKSEINGCIS